LGQETPDSFIEIIEVAQGGQTNIGKVAMRGHIHHPRGKVNRKPALGTSEKFKAAMMFRPSRVSGSPTYRDPEIVAHIWIPASAGMT